MKKRVLFMDVLICLSALFVVFLHSTLTVFNVRADQSWFESLFIQSFFRWPVPVFFMLCGANLLAYRERYTTKTFFIKRIKRVVIPFLVWSVIWLAYNYSRGWLTSLSIKHVVKLFIYNNILDVFWFFYAILGIYLCIPILSLITKRENRKGVLYFIILCLLQMGVIPLVFGIIHQPVPGYTYLPIIGGYLSYVLSGWYLVTFPLTKIQRSTVYISGLISGAIIFGGTYYYSLPGKQLNQIFFDYNSVFTYLLSLSIFVFFQSVDWDKLLSAKLIKLITIISSTSFGVYIIHEFLIFESGRYFNIDNASLYYMTVHPLVIYILSVGLVFSLKKLPFVRHIMP